MRNLFVGDITFQNKSFLFTASKGGNTFSYPRLIEHGFRHLVVMFPTNIWHKKNSEKYACNRSYVYICTKFAK